MLHASAIANEQHSVVISGQGGTGKTTTTSSLLAEGRENWHFQADDYVFLDLHGLSYCYVTRSHLYMGLERWIPEIYPQLTTVDKVKFHFFGTLRKYTSEGIKIPVRIPLTRMWPEMEIKDVGHLKTLIMLEKNNSLNDIRISRVTDPEKILRTLIDMNFYETKHFLHLIEKSQSIRNFENWKNDWVEREERLLKQILECTNVIRMEIPAKVSNYRQSRERLFQVVTELVGS